MSGDNASHRSATISARLSRESAFQLDRVARHLGPVAVRRRRPTARFDSGRWLPLPGPAMERKLRVEADKLCSRWAVPESTTGKLMV